MSAEAALIWCPFADEASAAKAVDVLLAERLIACGNVIPGITSRFRWEQELGSAKECAVLLKTRTELLERAMERLEAVHPYEQPAISGWTVRATQGTIAWLEGETSD